MTEVSVTTTVNFLFQLVILALLVYGYSLFRAKELKKHGKITAAATLLNTLSIFLVMIPVFISEYEHIVAEIFEAEAFINLIHAILGSIGEALAVFITVRWWINSFDISKCRGQTLMRVTMFVWLAALITGIIVYLLHFFA